MSLNKAEDSLLKGTAVLATAHFISKFLGFIYKAFLSRVIGDVGLGLYDKAYPIYTMILTISITGVPVALSKLVSEKVAEGREDLADYIFKVALGFSMAFGLAATILVIVLAKPIARYLLDDIKVYYSILAIAPAIFIVAIMATYRGYFQGRKKMLPTAISQVTEQLTRMTVMILLAFYLLQYGIEFGAAGASSGAFFGAITGLIVMLVIYYRFQKRRNISASNLENKPPVKEILSRIFSLAVPITLGALILPVMRLIDASMITRRLRVAGYGLKEATGIFGHFGMAMTLTRFPMVVATALAVNLVPAISEAFALGNEKMAKRRIAKAFKVTIYVSLPASVGLFVLAGPLSQMIYAIPEVEIPLRYLALGVIAVSLQQITSSILQGFDKAVVSARNLFIGAFLNIVLNYTLTATELGIRGASIGTAAGFTLAAFLNMIAVFRVAKPDFDVPNLIYKPVFSVILMALGVVGAYKGLSMIIAINAVNTLLAVFVGMAIYGLALLLTGGVRREDLMIIPKIGVKLADLFERIGLIR